MNIGMMAMAGVAAILPSSLSTVGKPVAALPDARFGRVGPAWPGPADASQGWLLKHVTQSATYDSIRLPPAGRPESAKCRRGGGGGWQFTRVRMMMI